MKQFGISVDLGGGANPNPGFINIDYRDLPQVDIVHNLCMFPWPLPDECAQLVTASHLVEHINPTGFDPRLKVLIDLLIKKKVVTKEEIETLIGETESYPVFMRFMDEVWRILKPGGKFMIVMPYGRSDGYLQDPTHVNQRNEATWAYFDPMEPNSQGILYNIYKPKPWKIEHSTWQSGGNMEVVLEKRAIQQSYLPSSPK